VYISSLDTLHRAYANPDNPDNPGNPANPGNSGNSGNPLTSAMLRATVTGTIEFLGRAFNF
jgi:hypothetical protein